MARYWTALGTSCRTNEPPNGPTHMRNCFLRARGWRVAVPADALRLQVRWLQIDGPGAGFSAAHRAASHSLGFSRTWLIDHPNAAAQWLVSWLALATAIHSPELAN